jgi:hypothetical protein
MTEQHTIEDYIDNKKLNLDNKERDLLLESLKNDPFNFKFKDLGREPMGIEGQNVITGLGIHFISEQMQAYVDSVHSVMNDVLCVYLDEIIGSLVQTINTENKETEEVERILEQKTTKINENIRIVAQEIQRVLLRGNKTGFASFDKVKKVMEELKVNVLSIVGD